VGVQRVRGGKGDTERAEEDTFFMEKENKII
jgi:hypothetical protein